MGSGNNQEWRSKRLLEACSDAVREQLEHDTALETLLEEHLRIGESCWPDLKLLSEVYLQHLATLLGGPSIPSAKAHLESLVVSDVYLAAACLSGCEKSQEQFLGEVRPTISRALRKLGASPATSDEIEQRVLAMILVGERPQLLGYTGKGSLSGWVRTIAVRTGRRTLGQERQLSGDERDLDGLASPDADVELGYLKERYRQQFREAFLGAAKELSERQRNILRQQHKDGLSIDALAQLYGVHRATAARWAAAARADLLEGTKERLRVASGVAPEDFGSILRLVQSQLGVGIETLLT